VILCYAALAEKCLPRHVSKPEIAASGVCLLYWIVKIENIALIAESSVGQYSLGDSRLLTTLILSA